MHNKKILLIAGNYYPEPTGIGRYNAEMIDWLADNGFDCTVLSTYPYYPYWKVQEPYNKKQHWYSKEIKTTPHKNNITVYRCPQYVPSAPTAKKRVLLDLSYFLSVSVKLLTSAGKKYDYVINVTPPLPLGIAALVFKSSGAKFLYHVQDLQVDAAQELRMLSSKTLLNILFKIEKYILKRADSISTISESMKQNIMRKTDKPVFLFPNWSDTKRFSPMHDRSGLKQSFGFESNVPLVLYSGAIGEKQGLEALLDIAKHFQTIQRKVQLVICGSGPYKQVLQQKATELALKNIAFLPLQPDEKLNAFLNMADVHLVVQKANAAGLVMPSKLANILSVGGLALITANLDSGFYNLISDHEMGLLCNAEDTAALTNAIMLAIDEDHSCLKINARRYAEAYLSIDTVMQSYVDAFLTSRIPQKRVLSLQPQAAY